MIYPPFSRLAATVALLLSLGLWSNAAGTSSYNGLALTPAMGWDNWNAFGCKVSEELILSTAQKIVDFGLRDLGRDSVACNRVRRRMLICVCRLPLCHPRRLLVQRQDLQRHAPSKHNQISRRDPCSRGQDSRSGMGNVFLRWDIYLRAIWY